MNTGCQNVLEPAALGLAVITGPSQYNFQAICEQLQERGALLTVHDETPLAEQVIRLLQDRSAREQMGLAGQQAIAANQGALDRVYDLVLEHLPSV